MSFVRILFVCLLFGGCTPDRVDYDAPPQDDTIMCTQELFVCKDGSMVGRTGPQCSFSACADGSEPRPEAVINY